MLGDWLFHAAEFGPLARGIMFRRTYSELEEVQARCKVLFWGLAFYKAQTRTWHFANGATLKLRYLKRDRDAEQYQGHQYTWMCIEEMGNFPSPTPCDMLRACLRASEAPVPKFFRATANPGGVGHGWIKQRYIDPAPPWTPFYDEDSQTHRIYIPSRLDDNLILQRNDPDYWRRVKAATAGNTALERAWRYGDWDVVAGGMFTDVWDRNFNVIDPFPISRVESWFKNRCFDWGSSKPYAIGYFAETDGTRAPNGKIYAPGSIIVFDEIYGWNGRVNQGNRKLAGEIADDVVEKESDWGFDVWPGPADASIYDIASGVSDKSIATVMSERGVHWQRADKSSGSRRNGWELMRTMMKAASTENYEEPGLYVMSNCVHWIRTVPILPRDEVKTDDVDTRSEDHMGDMTRYRLLKAAVETDGGSTAGGERSEFRGMPY